MSLKHQLRQLADVSQPNPNWVMRNRAHLLAQITPHPHPLPQGERASSFFPLPRWERIKVRGASFAAVLNLVRFYPRLAPALAVFALIFALGVGTVSAAWSSLPGSSLYPLKLAVEKVGLKFAPTPSLKAKFQVKFAGQRLNEAQKIAQDTPESQQVSQVLEQFKNQMQEMASGLSPKDMGGTTPQEAGNISGYLVNKTKEYRSQLKNTGKTLSAPLKQKVAEAQKAVDSSSLKAFELMAASAQMGGVPEEQVASEIQEKLQETQAEVKETEQKMTSLTITKEKSQEPRDSLSLSPTLPLNEENDENTKATAGAKQALDQAEQLLEAKNYTGAVSKMKESVELLETVDLSTAGGN